MNKLFLDLEETVVDSWQSQRLVNIGAVKSFLQNNSFDEVDVFSFAVWNNDDVAVFNRDLKPVLNRALNVNLKDCPSVPDVMKADTKLTGVQWHNDVTEFIQVRGKFTAFLNWCKLNHPNDNCVLLDDMVPNVTVVDRDTGTVIQFVNVNKIKDLVTT